MNINILAIITIIITISLLYSSNAKRKISDEVKSLGGEVIKMEWAPFSGPFGFGLDKRITYSVRYKDKNGKVHSAYCGVWFFKQEIDFYNDFIEAIYRPKQD